MRIAKSTVIFLIFVLMLSVFVANVANLINVDSHATNATPLYEGLDNTEPQWSLPKKYRIADSADRLMWFLQVPLFFNSDSDFKNLMNIFHSFY